VEAFDFIARHAADFSFQGGGPSVLAIETPRKVGFMEMKFVGRRILAGGLAAKVACPFADRSLKVKLFGSFGGTGGGPGPPGARAPDQACPPPGRTPESPGVNHDFFFFQAVPGRHRREPRRGGQTGRSGYGRFVAKALHVGGDPEAP